MKQKLTTSILALTFALAQVTPFTQTKPTPEVGDGSWCLRPVAAGEKRQEVMAETPYDMATMRIDSIRSAIFDLLSKVTSFCAYYKSECDILADCAQFLKSMRSYVEMVRHIAETAKATQAEYPDRISAELIEFADTVYDRLVKQCVFAEWAEHSYRLWRMSWYAEKVTLNLIRRSAEQAMGEDLTGNIEIEYDRMIKVFLAECAGHVSLIIDEFKLGSRNVADTISIEEVINLWDNTRQDLADTANKPVFTGRERLDKIARIEAQVNSLYDNILLSLSRDMRRQLDGAGQYFSCAAAELSSGIKARDAIAALGTTMALPSEIYALTQI